MPLYASLLDRLAYREDGKDGYGARGISENELKRNLLRDLQWLLNTTRLDTMVDLEKRKLVQHSVLNYGIDSLAGRSVSGVKEEEVALSVERAIKHFEPRLRDVSVTAKKKEESNRQSIVLTIDAQLIVRPVQDVQFRGVLDLDDGLISLQSNNEEQ